MDRVLVAQAQVRAGKDIHTIAGIVQRIYLAEKCLEIADLPEEDRKGYQEIVEKNEIILRAFIANHKLGKQ